MSQTIENRVVELQFENKQFESGVQESLTTLDKLKKSLKFDDMSKNLTDFSKQATKNFDFSKMESNVESLKDRFSAAGIAGMEVIKRLTNFAIDAGKSIANALMSPIQQAASGGWARAMNIENAKFQIEGLGKTWATFAEDIDYGVKDTAYSLDAAAKACAQLSASGVQAGKDMQAALRGISGVAAMANTSYENITPIYTKIAGNNKAMARELQQIANYGLNASAELAKFFNTIEENENVPEDLKKEVLGLTKGLKVTEADIREFASDSKINFRIFEYAMDSAFGEHAKDANKTFTGAMANIRAALSRIGADFATPFIQNAIPVLNKVREMINAIKGNLTPFYDFFRSLTTTVSNALVNKIGNAIDFISNKSQIANNLFYSIQNVISILMHWFVALRDAFRAVFPETRSFGDGLNLITDGLGRLTALLIPSNETLYIFRNIMYAVFTVIKSVFTVIKALWPVISTVLGVLSKIAVVISHLIAYVMNLVSQLNLSEIAFTAIKLVGIAILYVIDKLVSGFIYLKNVLSDTSTVTGRVFQSIKETVIFIGQLVGGALYTAFSKVFGFIHDMIASGDPLGFIVDSFKKLVDTLRNLPIIGNVIGILERAFMAIKTFILEIKNSDNIVGSIASKLKNLAMIIGGALFMAIEKIVKTIKDIVTAEHPIEMIMSKIQGLIDKIKNLGIVKGAIDAVKNAFSGLVSIFHPVSDSVDKTTECVKTLTEATTQSGKVIEETFEMTKAYSSGGTLSGVQKELSKTGEVVEDTTNKVEKSKGILASIGDFLATAWAWVKDNITPGQVMLFAFATMVLALSFNINKLVKSVTGLVDRVTTLPGFIANIFGINRRNTAQSKVFGNFIVGIIAITGAILGLANAFKTLSNVPSTKIKEITTSLAILIGEIGGFALLISIVTMISEINGKSRGFGGFAANMLMLSIGLLTLVGTAKLIDTIQWNSVWTDIGVIAAIIGVLVGVTFLLNKISPEIHTGALFLLSFAGAAYIFAKALSVITGLDLSKLKENWLEVSAVLIAFGAAAFLASTIGLGAVLGLGAFCAALFLVSGNFDTLKRQVQESGLGEFIIDFCSRLKNALANGLKYLMDTYRLLDHTGQVCLAIIAVAGAVYGVAMAWALGRITKYILRIAFGVALVAAAIAAIGWAYSEAVKASEKIDVRKLDSIQSTFVHMAAFITALTAIAAFASGDTDNRTKEGKNTTRNKTNRSNFLKQLRKMLFDWALLIAAIALLVSVVGNMTSEQVDQAIKILRPTMIFIGILTALSAILSVVASRKGANSNAGISAFIGMMMLIATLIGSFIVVMMYFKDFSWADQWDQLLLSIGVMVGVVYAMRTLIKAIGGIQGMGAGFAFIGLAAIIVAFGSMIALLVSVCKTPEELKKAGIIALALVAAVGIITFCVSRLMKSIDSLESKKDVRKGLMQSFGSMIALILAVSGSIIALYFTIKGDQYGLEKVVTLSVILIAAIVAIAAIMKWIQKTVTKTNNTTARQKGLIGAMVTMIGLIGTVAAAIGVLYWEIRNDQYGLEKIVIIAASLVAAIFAIAEIMKIIQKVSSKLNGMKKIGQFAAVIVGMMASIGSIVAAMAILNSYITTMDQVVQVGVLLGEMIIALGLLEGLMAVLIKISDKVEASGLIKGGVMLGGMIAAFWGLSEIFLTINQLQGDFVTLQGKMHAMTLCMLELEALVLALEGVAKLIDKFNNSIWASAIGGGLLVGMTKLFEWLSEIFLTIDSMSSDFKGLIGRASAMSLALLEMVGVLTVISAIQFLILSFGKKNAWVLLAFVAEGVGYGILAGIIWLFEWMADVMSTLDKIKNVDDAINTAYQITYLMWIFVAIGVVGGILAALGVAGIPAMLGVSEIFDQVAKACGILSKIPEGDISNVLMIADEIIKILWKFVAVGAVLGVLAPLFWSADNAVDVLTKIMYAFGQMTMAFAYISNNVKLGSNLGAVIDDIINLLWEFTKLGAVNGVFSFAADGIMEILMIFQNFVQELPAATNALAMFGAAMDIVTASVQRLVATGALIRGWFDEIASGIINLGASLVTTVQTMGQEIINTVTNVFGSIRDIIFGDSQQLYQTGADVALQVKNGLESNLDGFTWGADFATQYAQGIISREGQVRAAANLVAQTIANYLAHCAPTEGPMKGDPAWGSDFTMKFAWGMMSEHPIEAIKLAANTIGGTVKTTLSDNLLEAVGITREEGESIGEALVRGFGIELPNFNAMVGQYESSLYHLGAVAQSVMAQVSSAYAQGRGTLYDFEHNLKSEYNSLLDTQRKLRVEYDNTGRSSAKMSKDLKDNEAKLKDMNQQIKDFENGKGFKVQADQVQQFTDSLVGGGGGGGGGATGALKDFASELENTLEGQMNIFQKFEKKEAMSKDELLSNMRSQIQGMTEWAAQMQSLAAKGLDQGLYQELAMMGPQGAEYVGAFAQMTAEELAEANNLWAQSLVLPKNVAGQVAGAFNNIGMNLMAGEAAGIKAGKGEAIDEAVAAQNEIRSQSEDAAGVASPSWIFEAIGKFMMRGLAIGIRAYGGEAVTRVKAVCADIISAASTALSQTAFFSMGLNASLGLANGLTCKESKEALNAAIGWIRNLLEKFRKEDLEEESPSRLTERWGRYLTIGLANGIVEEKNQVTNALSELTEDPINTMRNTIALIGEQLSDEVGDPVITPVLDLSNVESGVKTISNMFSANQALTASASLNGTLQNGYQNGVRLGTTFIQNNYSPKALSRTEIYRQTKNQFSAYREAFS